MKSKWQRPRFVEICMNAEIGAYQDEADERMNVPVNPPRAK